MRPFAPGTRGEILSFQGKHREAVQRYDHALRLRPDSMTAVAGKAGAFELSGQPDKARTVLAPYVSSERDTAEMAIILARLDLGAKDYDAVIDLVRRHEE
ncbi:MAG: tetratricopeptide repeat protein, partial [Planctomycetota bacterium]